MNNTKFAQLLLRITIAAIFIGHGTAAIQGNETWISWIQLFTGADHETGKFLLMLDGVQDVLIALIVLFRPFRIIVIWAACWGYVTGVVAVLMGGSFIAFMEEAANWLVPITLFFLLQQARLEKKKAKEIEKQEKSSSPPGITQPTKTKILTQEQLMNIKT